MKFFKQADTTESGGEEALNSWFSNVQSAAEAGLGDAALLSSVFDSILAEAAELRNLAADHPLAVANTHLVSVSTSVKPEVWHCGGAVSISGVGGIGALQFSIVFFDPPLRVMSIAMALSGAQVFMSTVAGSFVFDPRVIREEIAVPSGAGSKRCDCRYRLEKSPGEGVRVAFGGLDNKYWGLMGGSVDGTLPMMRNMRLNLSGLAQMNWL